GVAPDDLDPIEGNPERLGGNQPHGGLGGCADVGDADVHVVPAARIHANHGAAAPDTRLERAYRHADTALDRARIGPRLMPALRPVDGLRAASDALLEAVARVRLLVAILAREIRDPEFHRVDPQRVRDIVHERLDAENAL